MPRNAGEYRISGIWGSAYDSQGNLLSEVVEVVTAVELGRIAVPLVGTMREGHKQGRETREGTMRVQKIDAKWELKVWKQLSQSVEMRREARDGLRPRFDPEFTIVVKLDDPEALGVERWQLDGCRIWRLPLGFNIGDELLEREYPITWENERPLTAFRQKQGAGEPSAEYASAAELSGALL
jgi:hypothetical protein